MPRKNLDCLNHEMWFFIRKRKPTLNTQSDLIRAKVFILKHSSAPARPVIDTCEHSNYVFRNKF